MLYILLIHDIEDNLTVVEDRSLSFIMATKQVHQALGDDVRFEAIPLSLALV